MWIQCVKCNCTECTVEKDVTVGYRLLADKVTCSECGNVGYINEHSDLYCDECTKHYSECCSCPNWDERNE